jgi:uncharacterized repeat protein (TIGR01451 family)
MNGRRRVMRQLTLFTSMVVSFLMVLAPSLAMAQDVPFKVYITELWQLDAGVDPGLGFMGDYYAKVTINGVTQDNNGACDEETSSGIIVPFQVFKNFTRVPDCSAKTPWMFSQMVPAGQPVHVKIQIFDSDLVFDDEGDAKPGDGNAVELDVDPVTGKWSGADGFTAFDWPQTCSRPSLSLGGNNVNVCWQIGVDSDGDGLLDVWERFGMDTDNDGVIDLDLPGFGANPLHKDLFVELDWMPGNEPKRADIAEWKQAFAGAPIDAGGTVNPDGLPGINLWVDTGALTDASGNLVGDNFGGGNEVPFANVSGLTQAFYDIKAANFSANRQFAFRYGLSSALVTPSYAFNTSTGSNTATTLNDTKQTWLPNEWKGRTVQLFGGSVNNEIRTVVSNTATELTVDPSWNPIPDETSLYFISAIGGQGELGGNDFVDFNHNASTLMHEFGHNLSLGHGGGVQDSSPGEVDHNCKPNYVSVMNYDHDRIFRADGSDIIDYSPPRQVLGGRSSVLPPNLDETHLKESTVLDPTDPDNLFVFTARGTCQGGSNAGAVCTLDTNCDSNVCRGIKTQRQLNTQVDWSGNGTITPADNFVINIDTLGVDGLPGDCFNNDLMTALEGHDDWHHISLPLIDFGDAASNAINIAQGHEPTLTERRRLNEELNTADLGSSQSGPATVEVGNSFNIALSISNKGPNPALAVQLVDTLPPVMVLSATGGCVQGPAGTLTCGLGAMLQGVQRKIDLVLGTDGRVCSNGLPRPLTNIATASNVARFAGPDPNPNDNSNSITVMPVDTTPPVINSVAANPSQLWPPNHKMVPVTVSVRASDLCDTAPVCRITGVTANEPVNGPGDGNTSPDWEIIGDLMVNLRAERSGSGSGREYTVITRCRDASGNSASAPVKVRVPHSR